MEIPWNNISSAIVVSCVSNRLKEKVYHMKDTIEKASKLLVIITKFGKMTLVKHSRLIGIPVVLSTSFGFVGTAVVLCWLGFIMMIKNCNLWLSHQEAARAFQVATDFEFCRATVRAE